MRNITDHIVSGDAMNHQLIVSAVDGPGPGNASHEYEITTGANFQLRHPGENLNAVRISFQNGPIKESGINGISGEALIAIVIDRLRGFQDGLYKCRENAIALTHFEEGLMWLQRRTSERIKRGVEGTHAK